MYTYEDLGWRTPFVVIAILLNVVLGLVTAGLGLLVGESDPSLLLAAILVPAFFGSLGSFLASIIAVCVWTHRACANAHAIAGDWVAPSLTPSEAVWAYFIPFVNLVRPYQATREIQLASQGEAGDSPLLSVWWGAWIVGNILANIAFRIDSAGLDFASNCVHAVAGVSLVVLTRHIHQLQRTRFEEQRRKNAPDVASFRAAPEARVEP
ncbi:MAG: DUF4328 domain-containing protein [Sandaracinus sp.]